MPLMFAEPPSPPPSSPEWVITYADMVTLLLTFFVMLASLSEINREGSYQDLVESVQGRFGIKGAPSLQQGSLRPRNAAMASLAIGARKLRSEMLQEGTDSGSTTGSASARMLLATILLDPAAGEMPPAARESLAEVAARMTGKSGTIEIRGLASREQMSAALQRAQGCADQLIALGLDPRMLKIAAAEGEMADSADAEAKARQMMRLELYLLESLSAMAAIAQ